MVYKHVLKGPGAIRAFFSLDLFFGSCRRSEEYKPNNVAEGGRSDTPSPGAEEGSGACPGIHTCDSCNSNFNNLTCYQPSAISYQPSAISHQLSAISYQQSAISNQPSAISYQPSAISNQPSAISHQLLALNPVLCALLRHGRGGEREGCRDHDSLVIVPGAI